MADKTLLELASENPNGWGENQPAAVPPKVFFDEYGQPYDDKGNRITVQTPADPTLGESLLNIAESPAKMLVGAVTEPVNALQRLAENSVDENGHIAIPNPENPENRQDVLTGILSLYGGNALSPGRLMEGAAARAAPEAAAPYALYRGAPVADDLIKGDRPMFMSSSPQVAETYAREGGAVAPAQANFENPMVVDAQGRLWNDIPFNGNWADTNHLAFLARDAGHDGLVIKNVMDHANTGRDLPPADTVVALKRGTVTSPLTGETLYSDTGKPSIAGAAVAGAEANTPVRAYHATNADFDKFDPAYTNEVGFHFGDKGTANNRAYIRSNGNPLKFFGYKNIPVDIDVRNPAELSRDVAPSFAGKPLADQLVRDGIAPQSLLDDLAHKSPAEQNASVRNWLVDNGYDAVKYPNKFEGGGKPSYMALGTGNVKHAKTGDVLYAGAPPVMSPNEDDQPLSLADLALIAGNR